MFWCKEQPKAGETPAAAGGTRTPLPFSSCPALVGAQDCADIGQQVELRELLVGSVAGPDPDKAEVIAPGVDPAGKIPRRP